MNRVAADQKSVLITGATDGLGKAAALLLAERSYRVFAAGRSAEKRAQLDAAARERKLPNPSSLTFATRTAPPKVRGRYRCSPCDHP